jgi:Raf kinase inhibitor-like YbhB/YbcL family protein
MMRLESSALKAGSSIPEKYTCDGLNISPPLRWSSIPDGTKALALICEDPDAPSKVWVHWVIYNIPPERNSLEEGVPAKRLLEDGIAQGQNDFHKIGYGGPCPPSGVHRYQFKLYALDTALDLKPGARKSQLLDKMSGHIIGKAELEATYQAPVSKQV